MAYQTLLSGQVFQFASVGEVLAKASEEKSGDILAGVAARSDMERVAAKEVLAGMTLQELYEHPAAPYEQDEVTRINLDGLNRSIYQKIQGWTVSDLREWLLRYETDGEDIRRLSRGLSAEMVAAVCKLMSNLDLVYAAQKIRVTAHCNTTVGERGIMGTRLQPNHTTDDVAGITASLFEGLSYGCGDVLIGLNPSGGSAASLGEVLRRFDEVKNEFEIPTQICVLGHISTQMEAVRQGAPCDMIFQAIAGSEKGNRAFGFSAETVEEARQLIVRQGTSTGPNVLYFETGQGSELSSDAHWGADQVTMEARCYGFARHFAPFMVTGIPMGCDCCYTNHMLADQNDIESLALLLGAAGANYILGVPAGDDIMLNYQTNAYHDICTIREILGLHPIPAFERWLERMGIMENGRLTERAGDPTIFTKGRW